MRAHRMTNQNRRAESPMVDHLIQVRYVMARAVCPFVGPFALAMSALVECEHVKILDERRRDEVPPMRMRRSTVEEQKRPLAVAAVVKAIQGEAVGSEAMCFHF